MHPWSLVGFCSCWISHPEVLYHHPSASLPPASRDPILIFICCSSWYGLQALVCNFSNHFIGSCCAGLRIEARRLSCHCRTVCEDRFVRSEFLHDFRSQRCPNQVRSFAKMCMYVRVNLVLSFAWTLLILAWAIVTISSPGRLIYHSARYRNET
jgi:hypothetical protein